MLERQSKDYAWVQTDPTHATADECAAEFTKATDNSIIAGCIMIGEVKWITTEIPAWCLLCDGATYANIDYPTLAAIIGSEYIIDADNFRVPDLMEKFAMGLDIPGTSGGEAEHTLTEAELTPHTHVYANAGLPDVPVVGPGEVPVNAFSGADDTGSTGDGDPFPIIPPYETLIPVIVARLPQAGD